MQTFRLKFKIIINKNCTKINLRIRKNNRLIKLKLFIQSNLIDIFERGTFFFY